MTFVHPVVPVLVSVEVTSLIRIKELQNWEALRAIKIALQEVKLSRASIFARPTFSAAVKDDKNARAATVEAEEMCMSLDSFRGVKQQFEGRQACLALCRSDRSFRQGC